MTDQSTLNEWEKDWLETYGKLLDDLLPETEVIDTGLMPGTFKSLRQSRRSGVFFGRPAPEYVKVGGKAVMYTPRTCFAWRREHIREHSPAA